MPTTAQAQDLGAALEYFQRGDATEALEAFETLLHRGGNDTVHLAAIYRHLGVLYATFGQDDESLAAFEQSLAIEPNQRVPAELGPDQRSFFTSAQRARDGRAASFVIQRDAPGRFSAVLQNAPRGATRVEVRVGAETHEAEGTTVEFAPAEGSWLSEEVAVEVRGFDEHGNAMIVSRDSIRRVAPPSTRRGVVWGVAVAAILVAAAGVTIGVLAARAEDTFAQPMFEW